MDDLPNDDVVWEIKPSVDILAEYIAWKAGRTVDEAWKEAGKLKDGPERP